MIYKWREFISEDLDVIQEKIEEYVGSQLPRDDIEVSDTMAFLHELENIEIYSSQGFYSLDLNKKAKALKEMSKIYGEFLAFVKSGETTKANQAIGYLQIALNRYGSIKNDND